MSLFFRLKPAVLAVTFGALAALPVQAQQTRQEASFNLVVRGLSLGTLTFSGVEDARSYAISGSIGTSGLAGLLKKMRYDANVRGSVRNGRYTPTRYEQKGGSSRVSEEVVVWSGGLPRIERQNPPKAARAGAPDPAQQRGTVDTLTTLFVTLRDTPRKDACNANYVMYDGSYRMRLRLSSLREDGKGGATCNGEYIRLEGFSPEEMAEATTFPFTLHYEALGADHLRVREVSMQTLWGRGRLVRK